MKQSVVRSLAGTLKTCVIFVTFFILSVTTSLGQGTIKDTIVNCKFFAPSYSFQEPAASLAKEFGWNNALGASFYFKFGHNILLGVDGNYFFGNDIRDDSLFKYITAYGGGVIGTEGVYSNVALYERGYNVTARIGKVYPIFHSNHNSGLVVTFGAGFIQQKIRIVVINSDIPELQGDYLKGYDHLTNGPTLSQYVGYMHFGRNNLENFDIGLEAFEGFTKNRRAYNFDSMGPITSIQYDVLIGIKLGFILPFYRDVSRIIYTY